MMILSVSSMMITILALSGSQVCNGFQISSVPRRQKHGMAAWQSEPPTTKKTVLDATTLKDAESVETQAVESKMTPKDQLMDVATKFKDEFGLFLVDKNAKKELANAVEAVEATFVPSTTTMTTALIGTWDLVSTTSTTTQGIDTTTFLQGPLKQLSDKISSTTNKYVTVQQSIKADSTGTIDRVDHIVAYKPPSALTELFGDLPAPLAALNVNPLDVSKSKFVLVHKATQSGTDPAKIALTLKSVILNVAGNSTYLDPAGKDITSINLPLGDFLGGGEFITTYVDDEIRVSRGKQAGIDFLRVFVKRALDEEEETSPSAVTTESEIPDAEIIAAVEGSKPSDVEDAGP